MLTRQAGVKLSAPMAHNPISRTQITAMLRAWSDGQQQASEDLIRAVYDELRRQARRQLRHERPNHTLDTAALINETYLKLVEQRPVKWHHRGHFFALAAELMRRILVDHARTRLRQKRGGVNDPVTLDDAFVPRRAIALPANVDLIALDEALNKLASHDRRKAELVKLRFFAGLTIHQAADALGIAESTADADWAYAKSWLRLELADASDHLP